MKFASLETAGGFTVRVAKASDVQNLLALYFSVYQGHYPLPLGTDAEFMSQLIGDADSLWLVAVDQTKNIIVGSAVCQVDAFFKIGRIEGVVVHPDDRRRGIAKVLVQLLSETLLDKSAMVHSLYATTRTHSVGPQLAFLRNGFVPLGLFPNAHRLERHETITLMAKHDPKVLAARKPVAEIPEALGPILKILNQLTPSQNPPPKLLTTTRPKASGEALNFEIILAPEFVLRKFKETFTDPYDLFFPFHEPNLLLSAKNGEVDIYGHLSKKDGYCALIAATEPFHAMAGRLRPLMQELKDFGVSYIEILTTMENVLSLEALLDLNFLPSAVYPAMLNDKKHYLDFVLMTRTMEPLNFRGIQIEKSFKPYVDQYVNLWKKMHLEVLGIFADKNSSS